MHLFTKLIKIGENDTKYCHNNKCPRNPLYHEKCNRFLSHTRIKTNTVCAELTIEGYDRTLTVFYCRDCIDLIFKDLKLVFDSKLWAFQ